MELGELESQLRTALDRIALLEKRLNAEGDLPRWQHLVSRPHRWRRQLSIKGRNMTVGQLVSTIRANRLTPEQSAYDHDLPVGAIHEALQYYAENQELIALEAAEERRRLTQRGIALEPEHLPR